MEGPGGLSSSITILLAKKLEGGHAWAFKGENKLNVLLFHVREENCLFKGDILQYWNNMKHFLGSSQDNLSICSSRKNNNLLHLMIVQVGKEICTQEHIPKVGSTVN